MKEAEQFAEEDKKKREVIDARNNLDGMCLNIEKVMNDSADKLSEEDKKSLTDAVEEAKKYLTSENLDEIKKAQEALTNVSNTVFTKMYQNMSSQAQTEPNNNAQSNDKKR